MDWFGLVRTWYGIAWQSRNDSIDDDLNESSWFQNDANTTKKTTKVNRFNHSHSFSLTLFQQQETMK